MTSRDPFQPELRWDPVDPGPATQLTGCSVPYDNAGIRASRNPCAVNTAKRDAEGQCSFHNRLLYEMAVNGERVSQMEIYTAP